MKLNDARGFVFIFFSRQIGRHNMTSLLILLFSVVCHEVQFTRLRTLLQKWCFYCRPLRLFFFFYDSYICARKGNSLHYRKTYSEYSSKNSVSAGNWFRIFRGDTGVVFTVPRVISCASSRVSRTDESGSNV